MSKHEDLQIDFHNQTKQHHIIDKFNLIWDIIIFCIFILSQDHGITGGEGEGLGSHVWGHVSRD